MDGSPVDDSYCDLEERVRSVPIEATKSAFKTYAELLEESNAMVQNAKATEQVIQDAHVMTTITASIHESTKQINVLESKFDPEIFAEAILNLVSTADTESLEQNWAALTEKCARMFHYAPGFTYINAFGEEQLSQVAKVVERKERQARKPLEQRKEPEKVKTITKTDEGVTAVDKIFEVLYRGYKRNGNNPVCFFKFVTDPKSFSKTVENIFHLSFLARDGHVRITLNEQKLPVLTPLASEKRNTNNNKNSSHREKIQALPSISKAHWKEIVRDFEIREAMIS